MKTWHTIVQHHFLLILKKIRSLLLFLGGIFSCSISFSQSTDISGIVNTYHKVIEIIPAKACVRVSNTTGLNLFQPVMLIQMKGATVNTANNSNFGDTISLNNAGNYETGTICSISGDSVFLFQNLLNSYTITDPVQLVGIPEYYTAVVVDTLKAASWDNSTGTGGVLAINVTEDLILNAPIYADSTGFKGGSHLLYSTTCSNLFSATGYFYDGNNTASNFSGAFKGESVVSLATAMSGGRGAPANGGGGGNNHNNGGGGGANLNAGGIGGGNSSTVGCTATLRGLAGKSLSSWNGKKIFLGGGGGAGHNNFASGPTMGAGNGGGIIFIQAKNLIGNGEKITANGGQGGSAISDGASGGGAGGSIIINIINSYIGSVIIAANGGNGGNEDDGGNAGRCYGAGGGGSGGVIYFNGSLPAVTISVTPGSAGAELSRDAGCAVAALPAAGSIGSIIPDYLYSRSMDPASYCDFLLPVKLLYFSAAADGGNSSLHWKISNPELVRVFVLEKWISPGSWIVLDSISSDDRMEEYDYMDKNPAPGHNQYRLRIMEKNNTILFSPVRVVFIATGKNQITVYPNPATRQVIITGSFSGLSDIKLFDLSGRIIWQKKITAYSKIIQLDLPFLHQGIYMLQVNDETKKLSIR